MARLVQARPDVGFKVLYIENTGTAHVGAPLSKIAASASAPPNLSVEKVARAKDSAPCNSPHCQLPFAVLPALLSTMAL